MIFKRKHLQEEIDELWVEIEGLKWQVESLIKASKEWKKLSNKVDIIAELDNLEFVDMEKHLHVQRKEK